MYLVIAEKPSVSKAIAEVIGASKKEEGYLEGKGLPQSFLPYRRQQTRRGGMCKRRLFRRMERHSPGTT